MNVEAFREAFEPMKKELKEDVVMAVELLLEEYDRTTDYDRLLKIKRAINAVLNTNLDRWPQFREVRFRGIR